MIAPPRGYPVLDHRILLNDVNETSESSEYARTHIPTSSGHLNVVLAQSYPKRHIGSASIPLTKSFSLWSELMRALYLVI